MIFQIICLFLFICFPGYILFANPLQDQNEKRIKKKKTCFLYGNCQMGAVYEYLKKNILSYEYDYNINFQVLSGEENLHLEKIQNADLFIYQPLKGHGEFDTDYIREHHLKPNCHCISFPYIYFLGYYPDFFTDKIYPYGSQKIIELVQQGSLVGEILIKTKDPNLIPDEYVFEKFHYSMNELRRREQFTDVKLADFIANNYREHQLFLSVTHPANFLIKELIKQILEKMGRSASPVDKNSFFKTEFYSKSPTGIIFPCVAKALKLKFDITVSYWMGIPVAYDQYIHFYVNFIYPHYQKSTN